MTISSMAFRNNESIPARYTCTEQDLSPELLFDDVPATANSLALVVEDPDAPAGLWVHWVVYNIPPTLGRLPQGISRTGRLAGGAVQGQGSNGRIGYAGPCPPAGTHRYYFRLYALGVHLTLRPGATRDMLISAMHNHIIADAVLMGTYSR